MTNREVALIIRDARSSGWVQSEADFVPYILSRGVTLFEYERYVMGRKMRWIAIWVTLAMAVILIEAIFTRKVGGR